MAAIAASNVAIAMGMRSRLFCAEVWIIRCKQGAAELTRDIVAAAAASIIIVT